MSKLDKLGEWKNPGNIAKKIQRKRFANQRIKRRSTVLKKRIKRIIRKMAWTAKKKTIMQVLTPR